MKPKDIQLLHIPVIDSTNRFLLEEKDCRHLLTLVADSQTQGKGRMGRSFFSPESGLYMSVALDPEEIRCPLSLCTPAAAVAVREALEKIGVNGVKIKWVNDLLLEGKKVCGILTQAKSSEGKVRKIVVGIGINLLEPKEGFPEEIRHKAGAINFVGDKISLAKDIALSLDKYVCSENADICSEYKAHLTSLGSFVTVTDYADNNRKISGTVMDVDENCFLRILTEKGEEKLISSGEII